MPPLPPPHLLVSAFETSPYLSLRHLQVEERDDTLVVRGNVRSFHHKQLAQETVRQLHRTARIVNLVEVHSDAQPSAWSTVQGSSRPK